MTLKELLELVKPKVKSLGLNQKEVEEAAKQILSTLAEDVTTEDAEKAVDGVLPYLKLAQSQANRVIEEARKKAAQKKKDEDEDEEDEDEEDEPKPKPKQKKKTTKTDKIDALLKKMESIEQKFADLKEQESQKSYADKMKERFKDIDPEFYEVASKGRKFDSEEEFEAFATDIEESWGKYSQKLAQEGLSRMAKPKGSGTEKKQDAISKELQDRIKEREAKTANVAVRGLENVQPK